MRYLKLFLLLIGFVFISCKDDKSRIVNDDLVSDQECIQFLNEVLSDTVNLKLIPSKRIIISNCDFHRWNLSAFENYSDYDFLYELLEEKDTVFVKNQIDTLKCFRTTELKNFGFQIYNFKKVLDKVEYDSIPKEIEKINISNGNPEFGDAFIMLQRPIFNKKRNKVLLRVDYMYSGVEYLLSKKNNSWEKKKVGAWMN